MTIEERAMLANPYEKEHYDSPYEINIVDKYAEGYIDGATEQDPISRADQKKIDKEIIQMLIDILQTSKNYHLGITAIDSEEEIIEKRRTRETALVRNIESKIKKAKQAMKE